MKEQIKKEIIEIIISVLGSEISIFLFGSRAEHTNSEFSDIDIGLFAEDTLNYDDILIIKNKLANSNIPYKVDIVDFSTVDKSFKNIALRKIDIWKNHKKIQKLLKIRPI